MILSIFMDINLKSFKVWLEILKSRQIWQILNLEFVEKITVNPKYKSKEESLQFARNYLLI
jgi:hypothetical protein